MWKLLLILSIFLVAITPSSGLTCIIGSVPGCSNCGRECWNLRTGNMGHCPKNTCSPVLTHTCVCDINNGYWYDPNKQKCVTADQCPPLDECEVPPAESPEPETKCNGPSNEDSQ